MKISRVLFNTNIKRIIKVAIISAFIFLCFSSTIRAQNFRISGGHNYSVALCSNGEVYAWGDDNRGQLTGLGQSNQPVQLELERTLPDGSTAPIRFLLVDAGSGSHGIGMACDSTVWTWGDNGYGQLGNDTTVYAGQPEAQYVRGGETGTDTLKNISYVSSGTSTSYAITADGEALAWGNNSDGQLGSGQASGDLASSSVPVYVRTPDGEVLDNVAEIEAGDYVGYALTNDGMVYAWGANTNGELGRNVQGNVPEPYYAKPVQDINGDPIRDITKISAGDTHLLALDADGNVWSLGGDWGNGQLGDGNPGAGSRNFAGRVVAGATGEPGESLDNVIAISAGQQHSMAVLENGRVLTWGGDDGGGGNGILGDGGTDDRGVPNYVLEGPGDTLENIQGISDGDFWTFAISTSNEVFVWGASDVGALGSGNTEELYATDIQPYLNCSLPVPCPKGNIKPDTLKSCDPVNYTFDATTRGTGLIYTWYRGSVDPANVIKGGGATPNEASAATYTATDTGTYIVGVEDTRTNAICDASCPIAYDTVDVVFFQPTVEPVDTVGCFADSIPFKLDGEGIFTWFDQPSGGDSIGSGNPANIYAGDITDQNVISDDDTVEYTVYAEDRSSVSGTGGPDSSDFPDMSGYAADSTELYLDFNANMDFTLDSFSVDYITYGCSGLTFRIAVVDANNINDTIVSSAYQAPCSPGDGFFTLRIPVGLDIPEGGPYRLMLNFDGQGSTGGGVGFREGGPNDWHEDPYIIDGFNIYEITSHAWESSNPDRTPAILNWEISTGTSYPCGRIAVTTRKECPPCDSADAGIAVAPVSQDTTVCPGDSVFMQASSHPGHHYTWQRADIGTNNYTNVTARTLEDSAFYAGEAGQYRAVVDTGGGCAVFTDSVIIRHTQLERPVISNADTSFCAGDTIEAQVQEIAGAEFAWFKGQPAVNASDLVKDYDTDSTYDEISEFGFYTVVARLNGCYDTSRAQAFVENELPDARITDDAFSSFCPGTTVMLGADTADPAFHYTWTSIDSSVTPATETVLFDEEQGKDSLEINEGGHFRVRIEDNNGCDSTSEIFTVRQDTLPAVAAGDSSAFCSGSSVTLQDTTNNTTADYNYQWYNAETATLIPGAANKTYTVDDSNIDNDDTSHYYLIVSDQNTGCMDTSDVLQVVRFDEPEAVITPDSSGFCPGETVSLTAQPNIPNATYEWFLDGTASANSIDGPTAGNRTLAVNQAGEYFVGIVVPGNATCADTSDIPAVVEAHTPPVASILSDNSFCESNTLALESENTDADYTYTWSKNAGADTVHMISGNDAVYEASADDFSNINSDTTVYYTLEIFDNNTGCSDTSSKPIDIQNAVEPSVSIDVNPGTSTCYGQEVTFSVTSHSNLGTNPDYEWVVEGQVVQSGSGDPATISYTTDALEGEAEVQLRITSRLNCTAFDAAQDTIQMNILTPDIFFVNDPATTYCQDSSGIIDTDIREAGTNYAIEWYRKPEGSTDSIQLTGIGSQAQSINIIDHNIQDSDTLYAVLNPDNSSCPGVNARLTDKLVINLVPNPEPAFTFSDSMICQGNQVQLMPTGDTAFTEYQWYYNGSPVAAADGGNDQILNASQAGSYHVAMHNRQGDAHCTNVSDAQSLEVETLSVTAGASDRDIMKGDRITLFAEPNSNINQPQALQYQWSPIETILTDPDSISADAQPQDNPTEYTVNVTSPDTDCEATASVQVIVRLPVTIPNAFSPNGDGLNDRWIIDGLHTYPDANIKVYNRWGNVVYETNNYSELEAWDGSSKNGGKLPVGTYWYVVELNASDSEPRTGSVTIVR